MCVYVSVAQHSACTNSYSHTLFNQPNSASHNIIRRSSVYIHMYLDRILNIMCSIIMCALTLSWKAAQPAEFKLPIQIKAKLKQALQPDTQIHTCMYTRVHVHVCADI